jgi:flagellar biosynthesis/type III secretory pathway M-ring protein FliF/YscJ
MEPVNYYVTTLSTAFSKLLPYFIFLVGGYFVFIRMPFLFFRKSMDSQKKKVEEESKSLQTQESKKEYSVDDYMDFQRKMKQMNAQPPKLEALNHTESKKKEGPKKEEQKKSREEPKKQASSRLQSAEEIFGFKSNETITKSELKKRYFELLKQNHPDRVASMGQDFKKLAEKNTKDINMAYDKLKNKAA